MENHCCFNRAQIYHSRSGWQIIAQRWRANQTLFDGKHLRAQRWSIQHLLILFITCCQDKLQMWNVLQAERCVLWTVQSCCETPARFFLCFTGRLQTLCRPWGTTSVSERSVVCQTYTIMSNCRPWAAESVFISQVWCSRLNVRV